MVPLVADEDVERSIIEKLRGRGVDVFSIDEAMKGALDSEVLAKADELDRPILTFDREFARAYQDEHCFLLVTSNPHPDTVVDSILQVLEHTEEGSLQGVVYISPG